MSTTNITLATAPVVADATARATLFPSPSTNQRVQNLAAGTIQRYDGSAWIDEGVTNPSVALGGGRTPTGLPAYLANNAVFNVADYTTGGAPLPTDGTTSSLTALTAALTAASTAGGGVVRLPYTPNGYNIGSASPGITLPSHVILECQNGPLTLTYSGTGFAIDAAGASYSALRNLYILTTNDVGSGVRWGGTSSIGSFWTWMDNVTVQGSGTSTNTGTSFTLDSNAHFCAYHHGRQVYGLGHKFGLSVIGQNPGSSTWTTVTFEMLSLVGRAAGHVTGSIGVQTDANSNLEGSFLRGVVIEGYTQAYSFAQAGGCFGFSIEGGIEANDTNYAMPPSTFAGKIEDPHGSYLFRQLCNGASNLWMQELIQSGIWQTQSHYDRLHGIDDGSSILVRWGVQRGGSIVAGQYVEDKFVVGTGASGDFGSTNNFIKFLRKTIIFDTAVPTSGSYEQGSLLFQLTPSSGNGSNFGIQQCTASGTIKGGLASNATTTSGQPTVTVDAISSLAIGDYITIAGAYANPTRIIFISGLTLTMASNASGSVGPVAVVYPAFSFRLLVWPPSFGADKGDTSPTLLNSDAPTQRFDTALTANRTCTLPTGFIGQKFRIVRHGLGAFTLTVQTASAVVLKVMPSGTAAFVDVEQDYTGTWILTGYGTL